MKKLSLSILVLALFIVSCGKKGEEGASGPVPAGAKFGVKAGMSEMTMEMMGMNTTVTNYWDDFGATTVTEVKGEMMGQKMHETSIDKDGYSIKYDGEKKTGTKMPKNVHEDVSFYNMTPAQLKERGMTEAGKETFLGKECTVYEVDVDQMAGAVDSSAQMKVKGKILVWNGIPMKMDMGGLMKMETKKLEVMESVPAAKFEVPADVQIRDLTQASQPDSVAHP